MARQLCLAVDALHRFGAGTRAFAHPLELPTRPQVWKSAWKSVSAQCAGVLLGLFTSFDGVKSVSQVATTGDVTILEAGLVDALLEVRLRLWRTRCAAASLFAALLLNSWIVEPVEVDALREHDLLGALGLQFARYVAPEAGSGDSVWWLFIGQKSHQLDRELPRDHTSFAFMFGCLAKLH